jgi:hypothetical protein
LDRFLKNLARERQTDLVGILITNLFPFSSFIMFFWFLQITTWLFCAYLFLTQVLPAFDYEIGVAMGTQERAAEVGSVGVAMFQGFCVADALVYVPLFIVGLLLHQSGYESSRIVLSAAYGITVYWPIVCLATVQEARGHWALSEKRQDEYWTVLPLISIWGLICLVLINLETPKRRGPGLLWTSLLTGGFLSPFVYYCNDVMATALHPSLAWQTTSISDVAATDTAHFMTIRLLNASAVLLILFGCGLLRVDSLLGGLQLCVGVCNYLTASKFQLLSSTDETKPFRQLSLQSQAHVLLVVITVLLTLLLFVRDTQVRPHWSLVTKLTALAVIAGLVVAKNEVGVGERISIYAIQLWTALLAVDAIHRTHHRDLGKRKVQ